MTLKITLTCSRELDSKVNYNISTFFLEKEQRKDINFPQHKLLWEVKNSNKKERKYYKQIAKSLILTASTFLMLPSWSMAEAVQPTLSGSTTMAIPIDFLQPLLMIIGFAFALLLGLALLASLGSAAQRMLGKKKESIEWMNHIIKGLVQSLIAPILILLIFYLGTTLLGASFNIFLKPS